VTVKEGILAAPQWVQVRRHMPKTPPEAEVTGEQRLEV
jgi:hypothetical protein